jgi:hypothetical protein
MNAPKRQPYRAQDQTKERALRANRPALAQAIAAGDLAEVRRIQQANRVICGLPVHFP